jgi:hypothetical protein
MWTHLCSDPNTCSTKDGSGSIIFDDQACPQAVSTTKGSEEEKFAKVFHQK